MATALLNRMKTALSKKGVTAERGLRPLSKYFPLSSQENPGFLPSMRLERGPGG